jgi:hypothetical protein
MITRDPLGTWETLPSPSSSAGWSPAYQLQEIHSQVPGYGDEPGTTRWYRQAKETKCGERDGRESERLVVPTSRGNYPEWTPGREGDAVS